MKKIVVISLILIFLYLFLTSSFFLTRVIPDSLFTPYGMTKPTTISLSLFGPKLQFKELNAEIKQGDETLQLQHCSGTISFALTKLFARNYGIKNMNLHAATLQIHAPQQGKITITNPQIDIVGLSNPLPQHIALHTNQIQINHKECYCDITHFTATLSPTTQSSPLKITGNIKQIKQPNAPFALKDPQLIANGHVTFPFTEFDIRQPIDYTLLPNQLELTTTINNLKASLYYIQTPLEVQPIQITIKKLPNTMCYTGNIVGNANQIRGHFLGDIEKQTLKSSVKIAIPEAFKYMLTALGKNFNYISWTFNLQQQHSEVIFEK